MHIDSPSLSYDDILIVPQTPDPGDDLILNRGTISTSVPIMGQGTGQFKLSLPLINAPMDSVAGLQMFLAISKQGGLPCTHRFQDPQQHAQQIKDFCDQVQCFCKNNIYKTGIIVATIGANPRDFVPRAEAILKLNPRQQWWLVDIANGYSPVIEQPIKWLQKHVSHPYIIAGNVCTASGFLRLASMGVHAVRVGIGSGSACTTRIKTGCGLGQVSALIDTTIAQSQHLDTTGNLVHIIADGGLKTSGDMAKALALGADYVMGGRLLAGTKECPSWTRQYSSKGKAVYRGMASHGAMVDNNIKEKLDEGVSMAVDTLGSVESVLKNWRKGLQSAMSYVNAPDLNTFKERAIVRSVSTNTYIEGMAQYDK